MVSAHRSGAPDDLSGGYRAVWRWHFYAGVLVMPILMLMALTGGLYLFKDEIEGVAYRDMMRVAPVAEQTAPDEWVTAASLAGGGHVGAVTLPDRPDRAVELRVDRSDETQRAVYIDPHTAKVTGVASAGGVMETVKQLHSLAIAGPLFNILVEIVAGWTVILFATGLYLWWPRGRGVATAVLTSTDVQRRPFWRDLHALTGIYVGAVVAFLAVTGMPWSAVWGDRFLGYVREHHIGRPEAPAAGSAFARAKHHDAPAGVGWTMEHAVLHGQTVTDPSLRRIIATADARGLQRPYIVNVPQTPDLAWTVARQTRKAEEARSLYIDGQTGAVKADIHWSQFGVGAKTFEWGIAVHQGMQYGQLNRIVMLLGCIGVWVLSISGLMM
ncbi:MAG: PepSY domain-containing protein, partial [Brevundimonas sp.]